jgi:hypothetical protein
MAFALPAAAQAQSSAQTVSANPNPPAASWHVAAGYGTVALRDIARSGPPVDASPVSWRGEGTTVLARYTRENLKRIHRYEFSAAFAGNFVYDSGVESIARPSDDRYGRVEGRYEYRRYFFRDVMFRGLDIGGGAQGIGSHSSVSRHVLESIESGASRGEMAGAGSVAARLRRWSRFGLEAAWINGIHAQRVTLHHSSSADAGRSQWGGGWLTDLAIGGYFAVSRHAALTVTYFRTGEGLMSSHLSLTSDRGSINFGVRYAK